MTKKKIIKYNGNSYTFHRDEDGEIHPLGEDYDSAANLIKNREAVVWYIAKKMKWKLPNSGKLICRFCGSPVKNKKKYYEELQLCGIK